MRAEELATSTEWAATAAAFHDLLAEWKTIGRTSKDSDEALWKRFKAAQDTFFTARNAANSERDAEYRANAEAKEQLLAQAERIDPANRENARAELRAIADKWEAIGKVPRERGTQLERRLRAVEKKIRDAAERPTPKRRHAPSSSRPESSSSSGRRRRLPRPDVPGRPRRPVPTPSSGGNGLPRRLRRWPANASQSPRVTDRRPQAGQGCPAATVAGCRRPPRGVAPRRPTAPRCASTPHAPSGTSGRSR